MLYQQECFLDITTLESLETAYSAGCRSKAVSNKKTLRMHMYFIVNENKSLHNVTNVFVHLKYLSNQIEITLNLSFYVRNTFLF